LDRSPSPFKGGVFVSLKGRKDFGKYGKAKLQKALASYQREKKGLHT
jgi:hypothetical protein